VDAELRLLLYAVTFGSGVALFSIVRRGIAATLWFHAGALTALLVASLVALLVPALRDRLAVPVIVAFAALAIAPSLLILAARWCARERLFPIAAGGLWTGAALLGLPTSLRSEARLYGALAASERGDVEDAGRRLRALVVEGGLTAAHGGGTLAEALPLAGARRWEETLAVIDATPSSATAVLGIEARAAAETGDLGRALDACVQLEARSSAGLARTTARRGVLAAAGHVEFLEDAERRGLGILRGPRGTADLLVGRAYEARGEVDPARARYAVAARRGRGALARDARRGLARLEDGAPRVLSVDAEQHEELARIEARTRADDAADGPPAARSVATLTLSAVTFVVSAMVIVFLGDDAFTLLAAGALSAPLVRGEGEWWRLFSAMLLHGGWLHLLLNVSCIVPIGVMVERRLGAARTLVIYVGSGLAGSLASVYVNGTEIGVGASGAAMGLIGALIVLLTRVPSLFSIMDRRRWLSMLWVGTIATGVIGALEAQFIDNAAHAAGALGGALLAFAIVPASWSTANAAEPMRGSHRTAIRIAAALLTGVLVLAAVEAAKSLHEWEGQQEVRAAGARARLPGWMRLTRLPDGSVVAERPPMEIAILIGSAPDVPLRPTVLLDEGTQLRRLFDAVGAARELREDLRVQPRDDADARRLGEDWEHGIQFMVIVKGSAFALVRLPAGPVARQTYAPVIARLRETLAATD